jgi:transcriptional regulator with XRE-family HTH domain
MMKTRNPKIPELCAAIQRLREHTKMTQKQFAAMLKTSTMSLSRWERGAVQPRDRNVLLTLAATAASAGAAEEEALFNEALGVLSPRAATPVKIWGGPISYLMMDFDTPQQWRLMVVAKLCATYYPQIAAQIEKAAAPVVALVDEVIAAVPDNPRPDFYERMEVRLREIARQRAFADLKKGTQQ